MTPSAFVDHMRTRGAVVAQIGRRTVLSCSGHEDHQPSLDVAEGRDGRVLLYCRAGCSTADVVRGAGLRLADLFATPAPTRATPRLSPLAQARADMLALGRRQGWARSLDRYEAADAAKVADRMRQAETLDTPETWERLAELARVSTDAEAMLSEAEA